MAMKYLMILYCLWSATGYAQNTDTIYYDQLWRKCGKMEYSYYRTYEKKKDLYYVQDHYRSGQLQMEGTYSSLDPSVKNGFFTYYTSEGKKLSDGEYYNNKKHGTFHQYNNAGQVRVSEEFKNDLLNGKVIVYLPDGKKKITVFQNGRLVATDWTLSDGVQAIGSMLPGLVSGAPDTVAKSIDAAIKRNYKNLPDSLHDVSAVVQVNFIIDSAGRPAKLKVINSKNDQLDALVIDAIRSSGTWRASSNKSMTRMVDVTARFPEVDVTTNISVTSTSGDTTGAAPRSAKLEQLRDSLIRPLTLQAPDTLAAYFRQLYLADKPSDEKGVIRMTFTADKNGRPSDIALVSGDSKKLKSFVTKGIKEYKGWAKSPAGGKSITTYYTLVAIFPAVNVMSFGHTVPAD